MKHYNLLTTQLHICAVNLVKYFAACAMLALIACSDDSSNNSTPSGAQNLSVATIYELGACDINTEGRMVTVNANEKIYKCSNSEWIEFSKESNATFLSSTSEITELLPNTEISSSSKVASSSYIEVVIDDDGYFTDARDGQKYKTVKIGTQTWMAENLNYEVDSSFCYNNSQDSCEKYGRLYQWAAAVGKSESECGKGHNCSLNTASYIQGVCPSGWHLPLKSEWEVLLDSVGGINSAGTTLKSTSGWYGNGNGIDRYGFSVLPAGSRISYGNFAVAGSYAFFWSASEYGAVGAYYLNFYYDYVYAFWDHDDKDYSFSVRCVRDSN